MKVLVAEDDDRIREGLVEILTGEGYDTVVAADGDQALARFLADAPDFICLDIMMPGKSGYDVCREIRSRSEDVPIIFISAKSEEIDKVLGLELGADDFITKPFGIKEVVARIRAVTRRYLAQQRRNAEGDGGADEAAGPFALGDLEVRPAELRAYRGEERIDLSLRDIKLLRLFHRHPGEALDRNRILDDVWGVDFMPSSRVLDQHVAQLRKRVEREPKSPRIIRTVHGVGYRYDGDG